jgi:ATP-dependent RNA helicase DDX49/DBP8
MLLYRHTNQSKDCIGCAKTGSGKTGAFALPILHTLSKDPYGVYALVLTPTRELAYQISEQFHVLGKHINLTTEVIVGGVDMMKQAMGLSRQPHVVIATPGRLADHLQSTDTVSLQRVKYLVLDEADRLLEPCFENDLSVILDSLPSKRQTLIFSATLTDCLLRLRNLATGGPFFWQDNSDVATVETLDQRYILMPAQIKDCYLIALLEQIHDVDKKTLIIFTDTCRNCQVYGSLLKYLEFPCVTLHSLMTQRQRLGSLTSFKSGQIKILVATDVASRGLDIPKVGVVVNLNVPALSKDYIHRVGRTARAGQGGMAITMMTQYDVTRVKNIESDIKIQMTKYDIDEKEALKNLTSVAIAKKEIQLTLGESEFGKKRKINLLKRNSHQVSCSCSPASMIN